MEKQKLLYQARLHDRGAAEMVLQTISASKGCQVSGPWESEDLDSLSELVQDIRLCSQALNKLDRQTLKQSWDRTQSHGHFLDRNSKCLLSAPPLEGGRCDDVGRTLLLMSTLYH
ncbi:tonsoku-like protein [Oreochromis niloticus]|uniref:tonsoku-like protein n=1 Tax=Oreochromis niloticus TaxID=8128 RepID=UPI000DF39A7F|nr:tonsoku-like protein [Oreochromis niloticus]